jgi:Peptidase inhibitor family I36
MKFARSLAVLSASIGLAAVVAAPTSARTYAQARAICPDNSLCLFEHQNWDGKWVSSRSAIDDLGSFGFNDKATSYLNDSGSRFCMYQHTNTGWHSVGWRLTASAWGYSTNVGARYNDQISSVKRADDPLPC